MYALAKQNPTASTIDLISKHWVYFSLTFSNTNAWICQIQHSICQISNSRTIRVLSFTYPVCSSRSVILISISYQSILWVGRKIRGELWKRSQRPVTPVSRTTPRERPLEKFVFLFVCLYLLIRKTCSRTFCDWSDYWPDYWPDYWVITALLQTKPEINVFWLQLHAKSSAKLSKLRSLFEWLH